VPNAVNPGGAGRAEGEGCGFRACDPFWQPSPDRFAARSSTISQATSSISASETPSQDRERSVASHNARPTPPSGLDGSASASKASTIRVGPSRIDAPWRSGRRVQRPVRLQRLRWASATACLTCQQSPPERLMFRRRTHESPPGERAGNRGAPFRPKTLRVISWPMSPVRLGRVT
jgi:hypothetical protein